MMKNLYTSLWQSPDSNALVLQATRGCSYNKCSFCLLYRDQEFTVVDLEEFKDLVSRVPAEDIPEIRSIFLGEGNALTAGTAHLKKLLTHLRKTFTGLRRVGLNATVPDIMKKKAQNLRDLKKAGLTHVYVGMESGDDNSLKAMAKGCDAAAIVKACRRVMNAGIKLDVSVLLGAGGRRFKKHHIDGTAAVLKSVNPDSISVNTLTLMTGTDLFNMIKRGEYAHPTPIESTIELRRLVGLLELDGTYFQSTHPSNAVHVAGRLPDKKDDILYSLDRALNNPADEFLSTEYFDRGS
jgi:radical SAM superfamily enzyme YgiQ (UPF0313 family)